MSIFSIPCLVKEGVQVKVAANPTFLLAFFLGFWADLLTAILNEVSVGIFLPLQVDRKSVV